MLESKGKGIMMGYGNGKMGRSARVLLVTLLVLGLGAGVPVAAAASGSPTTPAALPAIPNLASGATLNAPPVAASGRSGVAGASGARPHRAAPGLLATLLSTAHGRDMLRHGLGAQALASLERTYGLHPVAAPAAHAGQLTSPSHAQSPGTIHARTRALPAVPDRLIGPVPARIAAHAPVRLLPFVAVSAAPSAPAMTAATARQSLPALAGHLTTNAVLPGDTVRLAGGHFAPGQVVTYALRTARGATIPLGFGGTDSNGAHRDDEPGYWHGRSVRRARCGSR